MRRAVGGIRLRAVGRNGIRKDGRAESDARLRDAKPPELAAATEVPPPHREAKPLASLLRGEIELSSGCKTDAEIGDHVRCHSGTLFHPSSTCRMGSDELAVVDSHLRVRGIVGLTSPCVAQHASAVGQHRAGKALVPCRP